MRMECAAQKGKMTLRDNLCNLEDDEARPLDEHGKILSFPRGHVVKSFLRSEEVTGSVPGISEDVCVPLARRGQRAEKLDPQEQWSTRDRVFPRWFLHGLRQHQRHGHRNLRVDGAIYSKK